MMPSSTVPVLEIGGTHVTAALVDTSVGLVVDRSCRCHVVGRTVTGSWDLIEVPLRRGLARNCPDLETRCRMILARYGQDAALLGAAWRAAAGVPDRHYAPGGQSKPSASTGET